MSDWRLIRNIIIKATLLLFIVNLLFMVFFPDMSLGKISLYNWVFPGRQRLPFGENAAESYNLSLSDLNAMFASHMIQQPKAAHEFRVILIGDSSTWGTLLWPQETLAAQLQEQLQQQLDSNTKVKVYNLGYPTLSLVKDVLILQKALQYQPDLILWLTTLESFPVQRQMESPLVQQNPALVLQFSELYPHISLDLPDEKSFVERNMISQRRNLADLYRLQWLGFMWAATGIDQQYHVAFTPAQLDYEADESFEGMLPPDLLEEALAFNILESGVDLSGDIPIVIINEPIMISNGVNHEIRYNYYYPRWAYDQYRNYFISKCAAERWICLDYWNLLEMDQFTNTAIHYSADGAEELSREIASDLFDAGLIQ